VYDVFAGFNILAGRLKTRFKTMLDKDKREIRLAAWFLISRHFRRSITTVRLKWRIAYGSDGSLRYDRED
jgi:hypothetical protein